jgi:hypothetical protein
MNRDSDCDRPVAIGPVQRIPVNGWPVFARYQCFDQFGKPLTSYIKVSWCRSGMRQVWSCHSLGQPSHPVPTTSLHTLARTIKQLEYGLCESSNVVHGYLRLGEVQRQLAEAEAREQII